MFNYGIRFILFIGILLLFLSKLAADKNTGEDSTQVEISATILNCQLSVVNDPNRVDREQLFKHGALRDCSKKLALTVKMRSNSNQDFDDEYIPIEHVFDSASKKRIRLLNPYVLRMHWKRPIQAYQLTLTDTITGIVSDDKELKIRNRRNGNLSKTNVEQISYFIEPNQDIKSTEDNLIKLGYLFTTNEIGRGNKSMRNVALERNKRNEYNILIEDPMYSENFDINLPSNIYKSDTSVNKRKGNNGVEFRKEQRSPEERMQSTNEILSNYDPTLMDINEVKDEIYFGYETKNNKTPEMTRRTHYTEEDFAMYNIENPDFWHTIGVQLYEKLTTTDGKTVWNNITKGKIGSVSSTKPDWTNKDNINVHYKSVEWIPKEKFALPAEHLCVLVPFQRTNIDDVVSDDNDYLRDLKKECIVVPIEDVVNLKESRTRLDARYENNTNNVNQHQRHVVIRTTRALTGEKFKDMNIVKRGFDLYLTVPHPGSYQAHLDLEVRADDNQLVLVGASGRINVVVTDNTRQTRASLSLQVTNTGLAAARFRAAIRDYGPELAAIIDDKNFDDSLANPLLIPPRHTRRLHLEMPFNIPHDFQHFSVALVNDDEETVAIRNVTVKKGDRCFCVWHCGCACLSDDPELLCHEMSESKQLAAGLSLKNRPRHTRATIYYEDIITINLFSIVTGLLMFLLFLGAVKATLGLCFPCIASYGLHRIMQSPPKLDKYYENCLCSRRVVCDSDGWPVHPDTKQRTIRVISRSKEFELNVIYFIMLPYIFIKDAIMKIWHRYLTCKKQEHNTSISTDTKKCYSSRNENLESRWQHGSGKLRRWMTTEAQELSTQLWRKGVWPYESTESDGMLPLLKENCSYKGTPNVVLSRKNTEQEDTEYVVMQMQKSRESLAH